MSYQPIPAGPEGLKKLLEDVKVVRDSLAINMLRKHEPEFEQTLFDAEKILTAANAAVDQILSSGPLSESDSIAKIFLSEINQLASDMLNAKKWWEEHHHGMSERVSDLNEETLKKRRPWEEPDLTPWGQFLENGAPGVPGSNRMIAHNYETLQIIPEQGIELLQEWEEENEEVRRSLGLVRQFYTVLELFVAGHLHAARSPSWAILADSTCERQPREQEANDFLSSTQIEKHSIMPNPYFAEAETPSERRGNNTVMPLPQIAEYLDRFRCNEMLWDEDDEDLEDFSIETVRRLPRNS